MPPVRKRHGFMHRRVGEYRNGLPVKNVRKNVLFVSYYFPPCGGSGVLRLVRFVKNISSFGPKPFVLTVDERDIPKLGYGTARTDASYGNFARTVEVERARVMRPSAIFIRMILSVRVFFSKILRKGGPPAVGEGGSGSGGRSARRKAQRKTYPRSYHSSDVNPILKFLFEIVLFVDQIFEWAPGAVRRGIRFMKRNDIDVIVSSSPPWSVHVVGYILKKVRRRKWIMDLRDPLFGVATPGFRTKKYPWIIGAFYRFLEKVLVRGADVVICNCEEIREYYAALYPATTFTTIENSYDPDDYIGVTPAQRDTEHIVFSHFGELYATIRTPDQFLHALSEVVRENPRFRDRVRVDFYGSTHYVRSGAFRDLIDRLELASLIRCFEYVPHEEVTRRMLATDVLLLLQPHRSTNYQIPAKLFEYVAIGKPMLAIAPDGSATSHLIREYGLGTVCDPTDAAFIRESIATAVNGALTVPDRAEVERFSARQMAGKLVEIIDTL